MNSQRIVQLQKLIEEEPNDPFYVYALALEFLTIDKQEAKKLMVIVKKNYPNYLPIYYQLATVHIELDEVGLAEEILTTGIEIANEQKDTKALHELRNLLNSIIE